MASEKTPRGGRGQITLGAQYRALEKEARHHFDHAQKAAATASEERLVMMNIARQDSQPLDFLVAKPAPDAAERMREIEYEAWARPVAYFIGRGVITQADVDSLVASHYRWAEAALNMVVPIACFGIACATLMGWGLRGWGAIVGAVLLAVFLVITGRRKAYEFRFRVRELIAGNLRRIKEQDDAEVKTIHDVLEQARKVLEEAKGRNRQQPPVLGRDW